MKIVYLYAELPSTDFQIFSLKIIETRSVFVKVPPLR